MRVALDAMGGDHAPGPIVAGAIKAVSVDPELRVVLVGDQAQIEPHLTAAGAVRDRLEIFHCTQVVTMEESPLLALRKKPDNSISRCWQHLAERKVDAIVSAGNTGAMVAGGFRLRLFLENVRRPGIAALMPTLKGPVVILDVGANVSPKPEHLYQYGIMGSIFAKHVLGKEQPKIGLMNVGTEDAKGNDLAKDTHALFNASNFKDNYLGNVEGRDLHRGVADVIVTDGFTGNVILKVCEGVFERYDYHEAGGAPLLGIDGICIICHGSSTDRAIESALAMAANYARVRLNQRIVEELQSNPAVAVAAE